MEWTGKKDRESPTPPPPGYRDPSETLLVLGLAVAPRVDCPGKVGLAEKVKLCCTTVGGARKTELRPAFVTDRLWLPSLTTRVPGGTCVLKIGISIANVHRFLHVVRTKVTFLKHRRKLVSEAVCVRLCTFATEAGPIGVVDAEF